MKTRLLLALMMLLLSLWAALREAPLAHAARSEPFIDQAQLEGWLGARITRQLEDGDDAVSSHFPYLGSTRPTQELIRFLIWNRLLGQLSVPLREHLQSKISGEPELLPELSPGPQAAALTNLRINDPAQETGPRVQNGTSSAVSGQNIVVAYNDIGTLISAVSYSNDGGLSWQETHVPQLAGGSNLGSGVVAARGNNFYYAGVAITGSGIPVIITSLSNDAGHSWSQPATILFQEGTAIVQDKPWIAVDTTAGPNAGNVYVSWTEFRFSGLFAGSRIICATSTDGGRTFPILASLTPFDKSFGLQGSNIALGPDGDVNIAWGDQGNKGISFARSVNGGQSFTRATVAASLKTYKLIGPLLNSHFGANGLPSIAADKSTGANRGGLYIVFSAPSPDQATDKADVFFVRSSDRGASWSAPRRVNDDGGITDQFMPSVAVATDGTVGMMWYDRRNDPIHNGMIDVYGATSTDGGLSFGPNRRISTGNWLLLPTPINVRDNYHGDYNQMSALTDTPGFFFNWGDDRSGLDADVYGARIESQNFAADQPNLILSPLKPSQTVIAGQGAQLLLQVKRIGDLGGAIDFSASSDTDTITFEFDTQSGINPDEVAVRVRTSPSTTSGTHPIIVRAAAGAVTTTSTLRLNVLAPGPFAHPPIDVSNSAGRSIQPHLALDQAGTVSVVWIDDVDGNSRVYYSRSADGTNFSRPVGVSQNNGTIPKFTKVATDTQNSVHVVWQECVDDNDCQTMYSRSTDQGVTFSAPRSLSPGIQFSERPSIITNPGGEVAILWDGAPAISVPKFEIFGARSTDGGATFSPYATIADGGSRNLFTTAATSDGAGRSYLAYESCEAGNCRIDTKRSTDGFATFTDGAVASQGLDFAIQPAITALSNGTVYVAMTVALADGDFRFDIFSSASFDGAASFTLPHNISNTPEASSQPTIVADNRQRVYVAWMDKSPGNPEIFLALSENGGASFAAPVNVSSNITISQVPTLATDPSGGIHLAFEDEMDGNDEAYYFRLDGPQRPGEISSIEPNNGPPGTSVTIRGSELSSASSVVIGGQSAEFFVGSATELVAIVPASARTGPVVVETAAGTAGSPVPFTVTSAISVGPSVLDFGVIAAGQVIEPQTVLIRNLGTGTLKISALNISSSEFRLVAPPALPAQLAAGGALRLEVRFSPTAAESAQATLKIDSDDRVLPTVSLSLVGRASAPPLTLLAPEGGGKLRGGDSFLIQWQVQNAEFLGFDLMLSTDGGQTFSTSIATGLDPQARNFSWSVPSLKTKVARVAIVARTPDGLVFMDESRNNFKVKPKR